VTVLEEGGHIAEIADLRTGLNPLWTPPWPSIEPSAYDPIRHPEYGSGPESKLLAGIMGHNLCLDLFGAPSEAEAAAGLTVHGEASVVPYEISVSGGELRARATLPLAQLRFERRIRIEGRTVRIWETLENLSAYDRPIAWTQHVTLGPPFVARSETQFRASATRGKVYAPDFTEGKGFLAPGAEFDWPHAPRIDGGTEDLRVYASAPVSAGFTAQLMDPAREQPWFAAWSPGHRAAFGYVWRRADFPWLGIWDENHSREQPPWNGRTLTRGLEFGVSPFPEARRDMIRRGTLFGEPAYHWIAARGEAQVEYASFLLPADRIPEDLAWRDSEIQF
jgi:hypothetical protein